MVGVVILLKLLRRNLLFIKPKHLLFLPVLVQYGNLLLQLLLLERNLFHDDLGDILVIWLAHELLLFH
jgi:hypothetical protein